MRQRSMVPIVAGGSLFLGALIYSTRSGPSTSEEHRRSGAEAKKAEGLSGAGVGGNLTTGGHELSGKTDRKNEKTDAPPEKLPSGGVGGGVGAGGANVRNVEIHGHQPGGASASGAGVSGALQGIFGQGGKTAGTGTDTHSKDTKVASHDHRAPTKRVNEPVEHGADQPPQPRGKAPGGYAYPQAGYNK